MYTPINRPEDFFAEDEELLQNPAVKKLISAYHEVGDELIDLQQTSGFSKETALKELVQQIRDSIALELKRDEESIRFKESERVDFKQAVQNLQDYLRQYLREHHVYL